MNTTSELIERYQEVNKAWHFEGESGLGKFEKLLKVLGYRGHGFRYGSVIESFLADNSGAVEAIIEWIGQQNVDEWNESLEEELPPIEEDDEEEFDPEACPSCGRKPGELANEDCSDPNGCGYGNE
jgi:hypothetical protein